MVAHAVLGLLELALLAHGRPQARLHLREAHRRRLHPPCGLRTQRRQPLELLRPLGLVSRRRRRRRSRCHRRSRSRVSLLPRHRVELLLQGLELLLLLLRLVASAACAGAVQRLLDLGVLLLQVEALVLGGGARVERLTFALKLGGCGIALEVLDLLPRGLAGRHRLGAGHQLSLPRCLCHLPRCLCLQPRRRRIVACDPPPFRRRLRALGP